MSLFRRFSRSEGMQTKQKEDEKEIEILPSKIVNPPFRPFRRKTISVNNFHSFAKKMSYSIQLLNKLEKQEEVAKVNPFF